MNMIVMVLYIIGIVIENIMILSICKLGSTERWPSLKYIFIGILSVYSFLYPEANLQNYWYCLIAIPIILIYSFINLKEQYYKKIFYACVGSLLSGLTHITLYLLLNMISPTFFELMSYQSLTGFFIEKMITILILYIAYRFIKEHLVSDDYVSQKNWLILLVVIISAVSCSLFLKRGIMFDGLTPFVTSMNIFFLWVITLSSLYLYFDLIHREHLYMQNQVLAMQVKQQEAYEEELILMNKETRRLKHDLNNHILILKDYYHNDKVDNYAQELLDLINIGSVPMMENDLLMYLLYSKATLCREKNIQFDIHIFDDFAFMREIDLVTLFSNLLDNAIEAQHLYDGSERIIVTTQKGQYGYMLEIKNTITASVLNDNKTLQTTKENKHLHGQGLKIIERVVDSYYGTVEIKEDQHHFIVICTMNDHKKGRI